MQVLTHLYGLISTIGGLGEKVDEFISEGSIKAMVKIYRTNEDWMIKQKTLNFFRSIVCVEKSKAKQVVALLTDYGATIMMASDFIKFAKVGESNAYPTYLPDLMSLMVEIARHNQNNTAYMSSEFIKTVHELINSGNTELKVHSLDLVNKLTEDVEYRKHLSGKDTFS